MWSRFIDVGQIREPRVIDVDPMPLLWAAEALHEQDWVHASLRDSTAHSFKCCFVCLPVRDVPGISDSPGGRSKEGLKFPAITCHISDI